MARVRLPISKRVSSPESDRASSGSSTSFKSQPRVSKKRKITEEEQVEEFLNSHFEEEEEEEFLVPQEEDLLVPPDLYYFIRKAAVLRDHLKTNNTDMDSILDLESAEGIIRTYAEELKNFKELPQNWKYDPAAVKSYISHETATYLPLEEEEEDEDEDVTKGLNRCCAPFKIMRECYAKTDSVPLSRTEEKIWKKFQEFDKNIPGLGAINLYGIEKEKMPIKIYNPIVSLIGNFAIASFNKAIEKMSNLTSNSVETTAEEVESKNTNKRKNPQKNPNDKKRKSKRWSKIWLDFDEQDLLEGETPEDVKAKCKHCDSLFHCHTTKHGTSDCKRHLLKCKPYLAKQSKDQTQIVFEHGDENKMIAWKFDQKESKKALAHMVIVDELPFSFVEREGFRHYSKINQPLFKVPCRGTTTEDCYKLYEEEKNKLLNVIRKNIGRVCLTTDSWTSLGKKSYMALTGHFIDNDWKLNKKVLNFCRLEGHSGVDIGKGVESCVNEWGIDAIMAVSVDNASANDSAIEFLRKTFAKKDNCQLNGKWIHIRCAAHVLNLVVQDGIKSVDMSIKNIRYAVKWIKKSGSRIEKFKRCAESAKCDIIKNLILDVPTRWNSTYNMLEVAQAYEDGFDRYDLEDASFGNAIRKKGLLVPTREDWDKARKLCGFLKIFYEVTLRISGTKYVTSHTLVVELSTIRELLRKQIRCDVLNMLLEDEILYQIAKVMKKKFDKYYGEIENMNALLYFAFLLDPRNKDEFLQIVVDDHYGAEGLAMVELKKKYIHAQFKALYEDYVRIHAPQSNSSSVIRKPTDNTTKNPPKSDRLREKMKSSSISTSTISELDKYLCESVEAFDFNVKFDILAWWKANSPRFPILSLMARDLLAIPVSTVASESVFSTSGRVLDTFRSSLSDKSIESLICTQDWLRKDKDKIMEKEEDSETIIVDSSEDECTSSKRDINEDQNFWYEDPRI